MRESGNESIILDREARLRLLNGRLWAALGAYAALAAIAYLTLDGPFRLGVWIFCGGLTVMTLARVRYGG